MDDLIERAPLLEKMSPCFEKKLVREAPAVNRWIPCSERMPEEETDVIAVIDGCSRETFYSDSSFIGSNFYRNAEEVTYWMPKPEPPKEDET